MKLQVQGQAIRLRLSEDALAVLLARGEFSDVTDMGGAGRWVRRLLLVQEAGPAFEREGEEWCFRIPRAGFEAFVAERPRRDGHEMLIPAAAGRPPLALSVEVDVRDSRKRRHEVLPGPG